MRLHYVTAMVRQKHHGGGRWLLSCKPRSRKQEQEGAKTSSRRNAARMHALPQLTFLEAIPQARGPQSAHPWKHRTDTPKTSLANLNSQSSHADGLETLHNKSKLRSSETHGELEITFP